MFRATSVTVIAALVGIMNSAIAEDATIAYTMLAPGTALKAAQAAMQSCRAAGYQVAVAVVDRGGIVQVVLRDRFAGPHTPSTATGKAWTAVSFRTDTLEMSEVTTAGEEASGVRFVDQAMMVGGGVAVQAAGAIVGGVGVSGAPSGQADHDCALAGIDVIQGDLDF